MWLWVFRWVCGWMGRWVGVWVHECFLPLMKPIFPAAGWIAHWGPARNSGNARATPFGQDGFSVASMGAPAPVV